MVLVIFFMLLSSILILVPKNLLFKEEIMKEEEHMKISENLINSLDNDHKSSKYTNNMQPSSSLKKQELINPHELHSVLHYNLQYHLHVIHEDHIDFIHQNSLYYLKPNGGKLFTIHIY